MHILFKLTEPVYTWPLRHLQKYFFMI